MGCKQAPIKNRPNAVDDDTIDRGISGQSLRDKGLHYDIATGRPNHSDGVNLIHNPGVPEKPYGY